jgi:AraC-like DNA-binding protein
VSIRQIRLVHDRTSGAEAIRARFTGHAYDLHRHDEWLVGVTDHGLQDFFCRGARRQSTPGRIILIEPGEAHDGQAGSGHGFSYTMLYLPQGLVGRSAGFRQSLCDDPALGPAIRSAYAALTHAPERLARDTALDQVLALLRPHLGQATQAAPPDPTIARRARDHLHDLIAEDIGTDALAQVAGAADRFQLARAFRRAYNTSPHAYLVQIRLLEARRRLAAGEPPASVAAGTGFADQSHLGRWFRRAYGLTPAAYRATCTDIPDTPAPPR